MVKRPEDQQIGEVGQSNISVSTNYTSKRLQKKEVRMTKTRTRTSMRMMRIRMRMRTMRMRTSMRIRMRMMRMRRMRMIIMIIRIDYLDDAYDVKDVFQDDVEEGTAQLYGNYEKKWAHRHIQISFPHQVSLDSPPIGNGFEATDGQQRYRCGVVPVRPIRRPGQSKTKFVIQ